jgi:type I restriction enzyme R subunit
VPPEPTIVVHGVDVRVGDAGRFIVTTDGGKPVLLTVEEYQERLAARLVARELEEMEAYDLYDVLADLGYGLSPLTRERRAEAFGYKHAAWLVGLPAATAATLRALAGQFTSAGTEGLESPAVLEMPDVVRAGGLKALGALGWRPEEILMQTKARLFAA